MVQTCAECSIRSSRAYPRKLRHFRDYYDHGWVHASLKGVTPICSTDRNVIALDDYLSMAISLPRVVSAACGRVTENSPQTRAQRVLHDRPTDLGFDPVVRALA